MVKTNELIGLALDWAVAESLGLRADGRYSSNWGRGGPIVESLIKSGCKFYEDKNGWQACYDATTDRSHIGSTALVAGMRCQVSRTLGDEVEVPVNLKESATTHKARSKDRLSKKVHELQPGQRLYVDTTLEGYPTTQRRVQVPDSRRPLHAKGVKYKVQLFTAVSCSKAGDVRYLVCVERPEDLT